jgi:predicted ATPase
VEPGLAARTCALGDSAAGTDRELVRRNRRPAETEHVDASGRPKALPFAALADTYRDTFRLVIGPPAIGRLAVSALALVARTTGRAPAQPGT